MVESNKGPHVQGSLSRPLLWCPLSFPWLGYTPVFPLLFSRKVSTRIVRLEELVGVCVTVAAYKKGAQWNLVNKCPLCYRLVTLQGWVVKIKNQAWNPQSHLPYNSQFKDQWVCVVCVCVCCVCTPPPRPPALVALSPLFHPRPSLRGGFSASVVFRRYGACERWPLWASVAPSSFRSGFTSSWRCS